MNEYTFRVTVIANNVDEADAVFNQLPDSVTDVYLLSTVALDESY